MAIERLTAGLEYQRTTEASVVLAGGEPLLRLRREGGRARVDLVLLRGERTVEVSFQPAAAERVVRERARRHGADPNGWAGALAAAIRVDAGAWGVVAVDGDLLRVLGAVAHPVLAEAYAGGAATLEEVPRWAAPALATASVAEACELLFGAPPTRSVVRATAAALAALPGTWWPLALAVAAAPVLGTDDVVRSLAAAASITGAVPTMEDVRVTADGLRLVGRDRAQRLVREAAASATAPQLAATLRLLLEVEHDVRWPLPTTRAELERVCLLAAAIDPDPGRSRSLPPHPVRPLPEAAADVPARATPPGAPDVAVAAIAAAFPGAQTVRDRTPMSAEAPRPVRARPSFARPRVAPVVRAAAPPADRELRHGELARALAVPNVGGRYDLVLPRSGAELTTWGRLLGSCIGDFAAAVASGATIVIGVREQGRLVAAAELRNRQLVQLLGARNRPVPRRLADAVVAHVDAVLRVPIRP